jgi:RNA polymerase-binding transcription factor DksA
VAAKITAKAKAAASKPAAKTTPKAKPAAKQVRSTGSKPANAAAAKPAAKPAKPAAKPAKQAAKPAKQAQTSNKPAAGKTSAAGKNAAAAPERASAKRAAAPPASSPKPVAKPAKPAATAPAPRNERRPTTMMTHETLPKPKFSKDGIGYTKDFDLSFVREMYEQLQRERIHLTGQAVRLEDEAHQLVEEAEMGDVQFDDEGGEGDTMVVERERDLALSAQARDAVAEIDAAIARIAQGTYGYSLMSGRPLPKERLEAIPWSSVLVEEKVGGIGRR